MNKPKAVIYCRVSTKEQVEEGNSLITQEKSCRDYALKNGYQVEAIFIEQGESAKSADRTELKKLLSYCTTKKNEIKAVIAYKLDRVSRNTDDYSQIRILLKRYGVEIKSTSEFFEDTPAGRFMENIIANVAQFDNDVRAERSVAGMRQATQEGRYVWMAPLGYSNVKIDGKSTITPNDKAQGVKLAFEMIASQNYSVEDTRLYVAKLGICKKNGTPISKSYFYVLLRNRLYVGEIVKFKQVFKGSFAPIISKSLFDAVQIIITRKKERAEYRKVNNVFPLRRIVKNPAGISLTGCWCTGYSKKYPYYRFNTDKGMFKKEDMEIAFIKFLNTFQIREELHEKIISRILELLGKVDSQGLDIKINAELKSLHDKKNRIIQKSLDGVLPDEVVKEQIENITLQMSKLEIDKENRTFAIDQRKILRKSMEILKNPANIMKSNSIPEIRRFLQFVFPLGVIYENGNYRTDEICSIYKLKTLIEGVNSSGVPHPDQKNKLPNLVSFENQFAVILQNAYYELEKFESQLN